MFGCSGPTAAACKRLPPGSWPGLARAALPAALSVAIGYASVYPTYAPLLTVVAITVGFSRVVLAVHYPGDVVVGQLIAVLTATAWWLG